MNWPDLILAVTAIVFLAVGARLGSLWTAACLMGGFFGASLVDYYMLPFAAMMGGFPGAHLAAAVLLFLGGLLAFLIPGFLLSKLTGAIFLGVVDGAFGLITGALAALFAATVVLLLIVPHFPNVERSRQWRRSKLVRPLHAKLENIFNDSHFRPKAVAGKLKTEFERNVEPIADKAGDKVEDVVKGLKKKIRK